MCACACVWVCACRAALIPPIHQFDKFLNKQHIARDQKTRREINYLRPFSHTAALGPRMYTTVCVCWLDFATTARGKKNVCSARTTYVSTGVCCVFVCVCQDWIARQSSWVFSVSLLFLKIPTGSHCVHLISSIITRHFPQRPNSPWKQCRDVLRPLVLQVWTLPSQISDPAKPSPNKSNKAIPSGAVSLFTGCDCSPSRPRLAPFVSLVTGSENRPLRARACGSITILGTRRVKAKVRVRVSRPALGNKGADGWERSREGLN